MEEQQPDYGGQIINTLTAKIRDVEEKEKLLKDRLLLIGQNLVEMKDTTNEKIIEMKKDIEALKDSVEKMSSFIETMSGEFSKLARKDDLDILIKQAKMFQPLELVTKKDLENLKKK